MKRLLALLLALLLIASSAMAEGRKMTLQLEINPEMQDWLMEATDELEFVTEKEKKIIPSVIQWVNSMTFTLQWQDDALKFAWLVKEKEMLDLLMIPDEDGLLLQSSLIPKFGVRVTKNQLANIGQANTIGSDMLTALWRETETAARDWADRMMERKKDGSIALSDRDLADLVERVLLRWESNLYTDRIFGYFELNDRDLLTAIRSVNQRVREDDRYTYRWTPAEGEPWYGKLEAFDGETSVAELTLGAGENGHQAEGVLSNGNALTAISASWNGSSLDTSVMSRLEGADGNLWQTQQSSFTGLNDWKKLQGTASSWFCLNQDSTTPKDEEFLYLTGLVLKNEAAEGFAWTSPEKIIPIEELASEDSEAVQEFATELVIRIFQSMPAEMVVELIDWGITPYSSGEETDL